MSIQLDVIEPHVTGYSRVTLDIAAAVRTASAIKIKNYIFGGAAAVRTAAAIYLPPRRYVPPWW